MRIFGRTPPPLDALSHPVLGVLRWSSPEKGWVGETSGLPFCLSHHGTPEPTGELLAYAETMLSPPTPLLEGLRHEKHSWLTKYPRNTAEVAALNYVQVTFYRHKEKNQVFATLGPDTDGRAWRIEFQENRCMGLGFDS